MCRGYGILLGLYAIIKRYDSVLICWLGRKEKKEKLEKKEERKKKKRKLTRESIRRDVVDAGKPRAPPPLNSIMHKYTSLLFGFFVDARFHQS